MHAESIPVYSNWGSEEPGDVYQDKLCTYIDVNGVWHSQDCLSQMPALCKATTKGVYDDHTSDRGEYSDCKESDGWFNSIDDVSGHYCIKAFDQVMNQVDAEGQGEDWNFTNFEFVFLHPKPKPCANLNTAVHWSVFTGPQKTPVWDRLAAINWDKNRF